MKYLKVTTWLPLDTELPVELLSGFARDALTRGVSVCDTPDEVREAAADRPTHAIAVALKVETSNGGDLAMHLAWE